MEYFSDIRPEALPLVLTLSQENFLQKSWELLWMLLWQAITDPMAISTFVTIHPNQCLLLGQPAAKLEPQLHICSFAVTAKMPV